MKKHICMLVGAATLLAGCEQKSETVNPPSQEKKESNTTIVNPSPATTNKTETNTTINTSSPASTP
jgi:PBP1b-binding outer membrane lipoprotein LpoB